MGKFSRDKGKRGEREFCELCKKCGFEGVHRTSQFCGKTGAAGDVEGLANIHVEVKNTERLRLRDALEQSERDAAAQGGNNIPIVAHKANGKPWLVTLTAEDFLYVYGRSDLVE